MIRGPFTGRITHESMLSLQSQGPTNYSSLCVPLRWSLCFGRCIPRYTYSVCLLVFNPLFTVTRLSLRTRPRPCTHSRCRLPVTQNIKSSSRNTSHPPVVLVSTTTATDMVPRGGHTTPPQGKSFCLLHAGRGVHVTGRWKVGLGPDPTVKRDRSLSSSSKRPYVKGTMFPI